MAGLDVPQKSLKERPGHIAFLICGLCVALNQLAYQSSKTFEQAEAIEFTVTLALLAFFLISTIVAGRICGCKLSQCSSYWIVVHNSRLCGRNFF
jgi:hypothetical protein